MISQNKEVIMKKIRINFRFSVEYEVKNTLRLQKKVRFLLIGFVEYAAIQ